MSFSFVNFGRNLRFLAERFERPRDQADLVACLDRHRGRRIRARGSLHSWSAAAVGTDTVLDLRRLTAIRIKSIGRKRAYAEVGAGCRIDRLLDYLAAHGGYTLPTYGIIGKQTIAGAVATATHGAGRSSLSQYVVGARIAAYDRKTGAARLYVCARGTARRAVRCAIGCSGVVASITVRIERDFLVEQKASWFDALEQVLAQEATFDRQQFYLVPWSWRWYAQMRRSLRPDAGVSIDRSARLQRVGRFLGVDVLFNGAIRFLAVVRWWSAIQWFYRRLFPLVTRSTASVIDASRPLLTMRHDLYTHIEMELFVPARHVIRAAAFVEWVLRCCGGEPASIPDRLKDDDMAKAAASELQPLVGTYVHDYPVTFRRVLRDDALISMTSGGEAAWYAVSLLTYRNHRAPFLTVARFLAAWMARAYGARPHWGKVCPLDAAEIAPLYPQLASFRQYCARVDRDRRFVSDFAQQALGL